MGCQGILGSCIEVLGYVDSSYIWEQGGESRTKGFVYLSLEKFGECQLG